MTYLGLDYGLKHVGVAISDGILAEPLTTLSTTNFLAQLKPLLSTHQVHTVVIGQPDGLLSSAVQDLASRLTALNLQVELADETLSSQDAVRSLLHVGPKKRHNEQHSVAAAIILQSWLDISRKDC